MVQNGALHTYGIIIKMPFKWQCPIGYGDTSEPYNVMNATHTRRQQPKGIESTIDQRQTVALTCQTITSSRLAT